jgi:hypothetical protein
MRVAATLTGPEHGRPQRLHTPRLLPTYAPVGSGGRTPGHIPVRPRVARPDAVFPRVPPSVETVLHHLFPDKPALGSWEQNGDPDDSKTSIHRDVLICQPGVYFSNRGVRNTRSKDRSRGVSRKVLQTTNGYERLYDAWAKDGIDAVVNFGPEHTLPGARSQGAFIGLRTALARSKPWMAGRWDLVRKQLRFAPSSPDVDCVEGGLVRTLPVDEVPRPPAAFDPCPQVLSAPYRKMGGARRKAAGDGPA